MLRAKRESQPLTDTGWRDSLKASVRGKQFSTNFMKNRSVDILPAPQYFTFPALPIPTLPGLMSMIVEAPHNAIVTVLYNYGNTRFRINPAHRISSAGWDREG
jgi:hypothetical protein